MRILRLAEAFGIPNPRNHEESDVERNLLKFYARINNNSGAVWPRYYKLTSSNVNRPFSHINRPYMSTCFPVYARNVC